MVESWSVFALIIKVQVSGAIALRSPNTHTHFFSDSDV